MASNSRPIPINLRGRNVPAQGSGHVSEEDEPRVPTPASQPDDQGTSHGAGASSNDTVGGSGNTAPRDPTPATGNDPYAGLTQAQRYRLMEIEAEKQLAIERFKLAQLEDKRGHRREHSDDHYRDAGRKKASIIRVPDTQHLNNYGSVVMFVRDCEDYIASAPRKDFTTEEEKTRWASAILVDAKKQT